MSRNKPKGISIIILAYNKASSIYKVVCECARRMESSNRSYEIIVVDEGSDDDTSPEVQRAAHEWNTVRLITLPSNQGRRSALKRGFNESEMDLVCFMDVDPNLLPSTILELIDRMNSGDFDVVIGSRRHPESRVGYSTRRKIYSFIYRHTTSILFHLPIKDTQTGIKLYRREAFAAAIARSVINQDALDLELLVALNRLSYKIAEAPVHLRQKNELSHTAWRNARDMVADTIAIFYRLMLGYYDAPIKPTVPDEPRISVIIPSSELDEMTAECVSKMRELDYTNYDIRLVLDSECEIPDLPLPPGSRVIPSGRVGPALKRNIGVQGSDAQIIAFIDSDAWPEPDWLKNAISYFKDEEIAAVGGPAVTPAEDTRRQHASGSIYSATLVSGSTTYRYTYKPPRQVDDYPTCNLLVRRSDFDAVGGFHTEFWPGEDTILCLKLTEDLGKKIMYVPTVVVHHHRRPVFMPHLKQVYSYAKHRGYFARKFPQNSRRVQYFVPSVFVLFLTVGAITSVFSTLILRVYLSILCFYLLLVIISSIKSLDVRINSLVLLGIIVTHIAYGIGFVVGMLSGKMKEQ